MKYSIQVFKPLGIIFLSCLSIVSFAQKYQTKSFFPDVLTVQVFSEGSELNDPVIRMGSNERIEIRFDQMSHNLQYYSYSIELCNADWTPSSLLPIDYLDGFSDNPIEDSDMSFNTTADYINYSFMLPNENVKMLLSGNYVVKIYETDTKKIVATACFSIDENIFGIKGRVTGSTFSGVNTQFQQLNFEVDCGKLAGVDPKNELKILVRQNGRTDNQVFGVEPTYILPTSLVYEDNRKLIFEGGQAFYQIDFSHIRNFLGWIERIVYHTPFYHVETKPPFKPSSDYKHALDVNGQFKVHGQDIWSSNEIDYSVVHFTYPVEDPWLDGAVYVGGYFNYNLLNERNKMEYNFERKQYELSLLLKNGGYNYQYLFLPAGYTQASSIRTSGSHWQTENDYKIYIYYRPYSGQYDRLVGVQTVNSRNK